MAKLSRSLTLLLLSFGAFGAPLHPEAQFIKDYSDSLNAFSEPLQSRAELVAEIVFGTIALGAIVAILAVMEKRWAKIAVAVAGALVAFFTTLNSQYFKTDKDAAEAIYADMLEAKNAVDSSYLTYISERPTQEDKASEPPALEKLRALHEQLRKLEGRATRLRIKRGTSSPTAGSLWRSSIVLAQSPQAISQAPWIQKRLPDANYDSTLGEGVCSTAIAAREYARYDAARQLAQKQDPNARGDQLNSLIDRLVDASSSYRDYFEKEADTGLFHHFTYTRLFQAKTGYGVKAATATKSRWSAEALLDGKATTLEVGARKAKGAEGDFRFVFAVDRAVGGATLRLLRIDTFSDSSLGSTRWWFQVLADNAAVISVPIHRYDDGGKPTRCQVRTSEGLSGTLPAAAKPIRIRVEGYKPKDL